MKLAFDVQAMLSVLHIMGYGMLGGLIVMGAIYAVLTLFFAGAKRKRDRA